MMVFLRFPAHFLVEQESQSDATMAMPADPKDCEEYFFLAATAVKISMAIKTPQTSDGVFRINLHSLYQQGNRLIVSS